jgi:glucose 1-dehydrogenase
MSRFANQRVLITGGSQGIGRACAQRFAAEGASVLATYHSDDAAAAATEAQIRAAGGKIRCLKADLGDSAALGKLWETATADGPLDVLVLNAAYQRKATFDETDVALMVRTLTVNVAGNFDLAQRFIRARRAVDGGGAIVVHGSNQGEFINPSGFAYGVSKAALHHLVRHLAAAAARQRTRVNGLVLGWFDTDGERRFYGAETIRARGAETIPLGRIGDADEVANLCAFLASSESAYTTGSLIRCDGGFALAPDLGT